jgi:hypothetical protein
MTSNYESHKCSICGDTVVSPYANEVHAECAYFRLIADILRK